MTKDHKKWWTLSVLVSIVLTLILVLLWSKMNAYQVQNSQLVNHQAVDVYMAGLENKTGTAQNEPPIIKLKTGIFIQSIKFFNSTEVNLTGYLWQRYRDGEHDDIKPGPGEVGFVFPEQVDSGSNMDPQEAYRYRRGDTETIGWYFESTLRQPFKYDHYPFDHKTVWIRMWHKDFSKNVVLVPDFDAYKATGLTDIFGIEKSIVLGTWEREDTYFDYQLSSYDTNFGIDDYVGQDNFPELHYNFVIKRRFKNAFIVHLLPLFLVATLLFAALLTVSETPDIADKHGFNTTALIGSCSALFFVVLLAHIQLREQFAGNGIVYIEYFYFLMYAILVLSAANTYIFCTQSGPWLKIIHYQDNLIPKVMFWPVVLGAMVILTLFSIQT